jgi:hypothetical protein
MIGFLSTERSLGSMAFLAGLAFSSAALAINSGGPVVNHATPIAATPTQTITITGKGFGTQTPYNGTGPFLSLYDITRDWQAGYSGTGNCMTTNVTSWTNTKIVIKGLGGCYGTTGQFVLNRGDEVLLTVGNPTTGIDAFSWAFGIQPVDKAPGVCVAAVGSDDGCVAVQPN